MSRKRDLPSRTVVAEFLSDGVKLGREARIAGYAPTASSLIGLIDKSPRLQGPRFRSSVTQDPRTGLERFNMSFRIAPGGASP